MSLNKKFLIFWNFCLGKSIWSLKPKDVFQRVAYKLEFGTIDKKLKDMEYRSCINEKFDKMLWLLRTFCE